MNHATTDRVQIAYEFVSGWQRCPQCHRALALVAPNKTKRHICDPRLPDQKWTRS